MRWTFDDIKGKACAGLNAHLIKPDPVFDRPATRADLEGAKAYASEKRLQADCERYLEERGYLRLTAKNAGQYATGWFGHLNKPIGNPFMPDLFIYHEPNDRPALLVELKTVDLFQPGQREMIDRGAWTLCRSLVEFAIIFNEWTEIAKAKEQHDSSKD